MAAAIRHSILTYLMVILNAWFLSAQDVPVLGQAAITHLESDLQRTLNDLVSTHDLPGMTLAIAFNDSLLINLASGHADSTRKDPMHPNSRMLIGSVGKMFVSAVVLHMSEQDRLNLDDPIDLYLKDYPWFRALPNAQSITIRHLLQHTSGLPRYIFQPSFLDAIRSDPLAERTTEACIAHILNMVPLHEAGRGWSYSDTNYLLLGLIIEAISGKTYYALLREGILDPLGLSSTSPAQSIEIDGLVQGYVGPQDFFGLGDKVLENDRLIVNPAFEWTGGGLVSNVRDLALWTKKLHEGHVISDQSHHHLTQAVSMTSGQRMDHGYGLGTFVWSKSNDTRYGHAGFFPGYLTHVEYSKHLQYAIAIQVNTDAKYPMLQEYVYALDTVVRHYIDRIDEMGMRLNFERQEQCWNAQDIECYMEAYAPAEDIQTVSRAGVTYGYADILRNYQQYFPKERMGRLHFDQLAFRRLTDHLYFVTGRFNLALPGRDEVVRGWFSTTMQRINGAWFMITDHSS